MNDHNGKQSKIISEKIIEQIENEGWTEFMTNSSKNNWSKKEIIDDLKKQRMEKIKLEGKSGITSNGGMKQSNATNFVNTWGASTTTSTYSPYGDKELIKVEVKDITVEISYKQKALYSYTNNNIHLGIAQNACSNTPIDRVWKEIYGLKDGRMTLLQIVNGKHVPAQYIPESYEFDDEE